MNFRRRDGRQKPYRVIVKLVLDMRQEAYQDQDDLGLLWGYYREIIGLYWDNGEENLASTI